MNKMDPFSSYSARSGTRDKKSEGVGSFFLMTKSEKILGLGLCRTAAGPSYLRRERSPLWQAGSPVMGSTPLESCGHTGRISTLQMLQPVSPENSAHWVMD